MFKQNQLRSFITSHPVTTFQIVPLFIHHPLGVLALDGRPLESLVIRIQTCLLSIHTGPEHIKIMTCFIIQSPSDLLILCPFLLKSGV